MVTSRPSVRAFLRRFRPSLTSHYGESTTANSLSIRSVNVLAL